MPLSHRLQSLLDRCQPGLPLWDLCCDHGLLGLEALNSGLFSEIVFNDAVAHVLEPLRAQLGEFENARVVHAFAEDIVEPLTGNLVLAGIGGEKIFRILSRHLAAGRLHAHNIVACPEKHADWLCRQRLEGYALKETAVIPHNLGTRHILVLSAISN
jgi:tRNA (adenine22-N1)-methyltransferase